MQAEVQEKHQGKWKTIDLVLIALSVALMAICSWISIPAPVPFTLQTFAVFVSVGILGGRKGTAAVLVYILLGAVGIPVFAQFTAGPGVLLGSTGGYIIGFFFSALLMWAMERLPGSRKWSLLLSMAAGLLVCYAFGTAWFMAVYLQAGNAVSLAAVLGWCVIPFVLPDAAKIALAMVVSTRVAPQMRKVTLN